MADENKDLDKPLGEAGYRALVDERAANKDLKAEIASLTQLGEDVGLVSFLELGILLLESFLLICSRARPRRSSKLRPISSWSTSVKLPGLVRHSPIRTRASPTVPEKARRMTQPPWPSSASATNNNPERSHRGYQVRTAWRQ